MPMGDAIKWSPFWCFACGRIQKEGPEKIKKEGAEEDQYKIGKIMALQYMPRHEDVQTLLEDKKKGTEEDQYKIGKIMALQYMPRHEDVQTLLEEIAIQVQPILIRHKWTIRILQETWSEESSSVLGLKLGEDVMLLRVRSDDNKHVFRPIHDIIDTMFHQLCHDDRGSHLLFKKLLNQLRMEYDDLVSRRASITTSMLSDVQGKCLEDMTRRCPPSTKTCDLQEKRLSQNYLSYEVDQSCPLEHCSTCSRLQKETPYKVREIRALRNMPRYKDAQKLLEEIVMEVKPIMNKYKWRIQILSEFWPENAHLLGLNSEKGVNVMLRLRMNDNEEEFLPFHNILDTMLHELCHNVYSSHNLDFHNLWNDLRMEYDEMKSQKRLTASSGVSNLEGRRPEDMMRQCPPSTKAEENSTKAEEKCLGRQVPRQPCWRTLFKFRNPLLFHIIPWAVTFTS